MPASPVRTGRDDRRHAILQVARDIFMREGYAAASMSAIAARIGGSKGTLYNYFSSKESLFAALVESECETDAWIVSVLAAPGGGVAATLEQIGRGFLDFVLGDTARGLHRLVIAEAGRFPELGRAFYENGPRLGVQRLAQWLAAEMEAGRVRRGDPERMATLYLDLCKSGLYQTLMWNVAPAPTAAAKAANVQVAVTVFMAAYGMERAERQGIETEGRR